MAEYNPSKIIKDGNTYNFRDTTKIPLAGSNAISGDLIPATDNSIDIGSSTNNIKMLYTKGFTINGTQFLPSDYIPRSGGAVISGSNFYKTVDNDFLRFCGATDYQKGSSIILRGKDANDAGILTLVARDDSSSAIMNIRPDGTIVWRDSIIIAADQIRRADNSWYNSFWGGNEPMAGGRVLVYGYNHSSYGGCVKLLPALSSSSFKEMNIRPDGTWTWNGTACQITSDQRFKQRISKIDDNLLDAWEDVDLVQFKYNDAVKEKSDNARLHTGYVVQQIGKACKSHNVDVSKYGLYCHEEYPEETEEVEVEQADGTKTKERKVIREASEHYSLRYTEVYAVECMYLRRCIARLTARIEELEKGNNTK